MLQSTGYPANFIKEATRPPRGIFAIPNQPENAPPTIRRSFPYIQNIPESVDRRLNPCYVKIAHRPHSPVRSNLVHFKDPVPTLQRCKVIYQIPYSDCDITRQAYRFIGTRFKERRCSIRRHAPNSCLAIQCMDTGHTFNWQDTRSLALGERFLKMT